MDVSTLRFYDVPFIEAEGSWPDDVRQRMKRRAQKVVVRRLGWGTMFAFAWQMTKARRHVKSMDISRLRDRGLSHEQFIALKALVGAEQAIDISREVMEESSHEPMLLCLPEQHRVRELGEPFEVITEYMRAMPGAAARGGSHEMEVVEDTAETFEFDVTWCVWLELARTAGVLEACIANCHADDSASATSAPRRWHAAGRAVTFDSSCPKTPRFTSSLRSRAAGSPPTCSRARGGPSARGGCPPP